MHGEGAAACGGLSSTVGLAPSRARGVLGSTQAWHTLPKASVAIKGCPELFRWGVGTPPPSVNVCSGLKCFWAALL